MNKKNPNIANTPSVSPPTAKPQAEGENLVGDHDEIQSLQQQIKTLDENWKRALADYQNLVRRVESDKREFIKLANANLIARLLPSLDIMEISAAQSQDIGVSLAAKQFHQALVEEGLQIIEPSLDTPFNHQEHECSETVTVPEGKAENTISELVLKGYKVGDYVLRPAKVKVYKN
jgi:molecular chaperone GrpE